jgi:hypothetical protein
LTFECICFFEKVVKRIHSGSSFGFKASLFLLFAFGGCSEISRVVVVLVTIETANIGRLKILKRIAYNTGKRFLIIYW